MQEINKKNSKFDIFPFPCHVGFLPHMLIGHLLQVSCVISYSLRSTRSQQETGRVHAGVLKVGRPALECIGLRIAVQSSSRVLVFTISKCTQLLGTQGHGDL